MVNVVFIYDRLLVWNNSTVSLKKQLTAEIAGR